MDIILIVIGSLLLLTIAFIFIDYKSDGLRRKKAEQAEESKSAKVFEDAHRFIEQYRLMDNEIAENKKRGGNCSDI